MGLVWYAGGGPQPGGGASGPRVGHGAVRRHDDVLVVAVVAVQEAQRMTDLVRNDGEEVVTAKCRRGRIGELRRVERCRVDEPAVAVAVPVEDSLALGRTTGGVELGDV